MHAMEGFLLIISFHIIRFRTRKWLVFCCLSYDYFAINSYQRQIFPPHTFYLWACKRLNNTFYFSRCPVYILICNGFTPTFNQSCQQLMLGQHYLFLCVFRNMVSTSYWLADSVFVKNSLSHIYSEKNRCFSRYLVYNCKSISALCCC